MMCKRMWSSALLLLLFLLWPRLAGAIQSVNAVEYGPWSPWTEEIIAPADGIEVERKVLSTVVDKISWRYTRYVYQHATNDNWYATAKEPQAALCKPGTGRWEERVMQQALPFTGQRDGVSVYDDNWFNEEVTSEQMSKQSVVYRSRDARKVTCEVTAAQMLMFPGDTRQLTVNFYDKGALTYDSETPSVATVAYDGVVTAHQYGVSRITVRSSMGRQVQVEIMVCEQRARIDFGVYTFHLLGRGKALSTGRSLGSKIENLMIKPYRAERNQRFIVDNTTQGVFKVHPMKQKKWNMDIARKGNRIEPGHNVQTTKVKDRSAQLWRAIAVPDGTYIIYPNAHTDLVLGLNKKGKGNNVIVVEMNDIDTAARWLLVRADEAARPAPCIRPVEKDGTSMVTREYSEEHPGLAISTGGRRTYVYSTARGKVVEISNSCIHDRAKALQPGGDLVDPCDPNSLSLGNYVVVDHGSFVSVYAHLSQVCVKVGQQISQGAVVGRAGATGATGEVGLFLQMRSGGKPFDPRTKITLPAIREPITG